MGLAGMAVAQPLLSVFGENPEFFVFLNARRVDTVVFAAVVVLLVPLVLFALEGLLGLLSRPAMAVLHVVFVAVLTYLFAVQLLSEPSPGLLAVIVAVALGAGVATLYVRFSGFRTWTRVLLFVPVLATVSFFAWSPTGELFAAHASAPVEAEEVLLVPEDQVAPVIFLVFDEFPTRVLLGEDATIDETRFPNFARLADESTWYRSHSTVSSRTDYAVPAMLSSIEPRPVDPLFTEHPDNLFRLFGETHHLTVSESLTALCPPSQCGYAPIAPPAPRAARVVEPTPEPAAEFVADPLYDRARDVLLDRVLPGRDAAGSQADFEETFVGGTTTIVAPPPETSTTASRPDATVDDDITVEDFWIRVRTAPGGQPARYQDMLDVIRPTDQPTLWFLHLLLPHFPWRFHPGGDEYAVTASLGEVDRNRTNTWVNDLNQARLDLQTQYLDGLLGEMLARFDEAGVYDDAVVVVAADHGESFELDVLGRDFENGRPSDVLYTPLFIKQPGQTRGEINDDNVSVFDVLPTVAAATGVRVPWPIEGVDLATGASAQRDGTKTVWRYQGEFEPQATGVFEYQQDELDAELRRDGLPSPRQAGDHELSDLYQPLGPVADLYGQPFSEVASGPPTTTATIDDRHLIESPPPGEIPLGVIAGTLGGDAGADGAVAVIAIDDRISALSPLSTFQGLERSFVALLAPEALQAGGTHRIDVGVWTPEGGLQSTDLT